MFSKGGVGASCTMGLQYIVLAGGRDLCVYMGLLCFFVFVSARRCCLLCLQVGGWVVLSIFGEQEVLVMPQCG